MNDADADIRALAEELNPEAAKVLRQGIVTAVSGQRCSVKWGASPIPYPDQVCVGSYAPVVGDVVWGIRDGDDMLVLGRGGDAPTGPVKLFDSGVLAAGGVVYIDNIPQNFYSLELRGHVVNIGGAGGIGVDVNYNVAGRIASWDNKSWYFHWNLQIFQGSSANEAFAFLGDQTGGTTESPAGISNFQAMINNYNDGGSPKRFDWRNAGGTDDTPYSQGGQARGYRDGKPVTSMAVRSMNSYGIGAGSRVIMYGYP